MKELEQRSARRDEIARQRNREQEIRRAADYKDQEARTTARLAANANESQEKLATMLERATEAAWEAAERRALADRIAREIEYKERLAKLDLPI